MTTPSAELMITPEVATSALKQMQADFNKSFKKIADDAQKQIDKGIQDGVKGGARKSKGVFRRMGQSAAGGIRKGFDGLGGARGLAGSVLGVGLVSYLDRIAKADAGQDLLGTLFESNSAQNQQAVATAGGMTLAEFQQFGLTLRQGGFTEQQDINDVVFDLNERVGLAANGEETILKEFVGLQGKELLNSFLAAIGNQSGQQQSKYLADLGFGGETGGNLLGVIQNAQRAVLTADGVAIDSKGANLNTADPEKVKAYLDEQNKTEGQRLAEQLGKEAELTKIFRDKELAFQQEQRENLFNQIDSGKIDTFFETRNRETASQVKLLEQFNKNSADAMKARDGLKMAMEGLNYAVGNIEKSVLYIADWLGMKNGEDTAKETRLNAADKVGGSQPDTWFNRTFGNVGSTPNTGTNKNSASANRRANRGQRR